MSFASLGASVARLSIFAICCLGGYQIAIHSFDGKVALAGIDRARRSDRVPAAQGAETDAGQPIGEASEKPIRLSADGVLGRTAKDFVALSSAEWVDRKLNRVAIRFAEFIVVSSIDGRKRLSCTEFDQVQLVLKAEGMASAGMIPQMQVTAPCISNLETGESEPVEVPFGSIHERPAEDGVIVLAQYPGYSFEASNVFGVWPSTWVLSSARLSASDGLASFDLPIDQSEPLKFRIEAAN